MSTFSHLDVLSLPVSRQFEKVVLSNEVSMQFEDSKTLQSQCVMCEPFII